MFSFWFVVCEGCLLFGWVGEDGDFVFMLVSGLDVFVVS